MLSPHHPLRAVWRVLPNLGADSRDARQRPRLAYRGGGRACLHPARHSAVSQDRRSQRRHRHTGRRAPGHRDIVSAKRSWQPQPGLASAELQRVRESQEGRPMLEFKVHADFQRRLRQIGLLRRIASMRVFGIWTRVSFIGQLSSRVRLGRLSRSLCAWSFPHSGDQKRSTSASSVGRHSGLRRMTHPSR